LAVGQREEFAAAHQTARLTVARRLESCGALREALELYLALLKDDELQESYQRDAMRLEAALGQRSAALKRFERLKQLLSDELGLQPLPETLALAVQLGSMVSVSIKRASNTPFDENSSESSERGIPLVGRKTAWAKLEATSTGLMLVTGMVGIGKTRLAQAFARTFAPVLKLEAVELSRQTPLQPLVMALREVLAEPRVLAKFDPLRWNGVVRLLPELEKLEVSDLDGNELLNDLARALQAIVKPGGIIVLEHLHWFDQASLDLLQRLAQHESGLRLLATARESELKHNSSALKVLSQLEANRRLTRIPLEALVESEVLTLTRAVLSASSAQVLTQPLLEATGGNPLLILKTLEFLRASGWVRAQSFDPIPLAPKVQAVVLEQLLTFEPKTRRWLELASLSPLEFSLCDLGLNLDDARDWLEDCVLAGFLEPTKEGRYCFAQPLARAAVMNAVSFERQKLLQRQLELVNLKMEYGG
jgi:AAA ATPase domain/Bacterial transcriptional activator domain